MSWRDEEYFKYLNIYKSECATWRDEKYFKYLNINQNVQRGEMRNEKCTFDPGSDMIHWRQNVTFFGTACILHLLQVHITT